MSTHAMSTLKELESVNLDGVNLPGRSYLSPTLGTLTYFPRHRAT